MKKIFLLACLFLFVAMTPSSQQSKRVFITLDVSGSMYNDKYVLANYTVQMIYTLCDEEDEVFLIMAGHKNNLSKMKKPMQKMQHPVSSPMNPLIPAFSDVNFEINDIITFNDFYKPSKDKQDWIFIIGDGVWDYYDHYPDAVKKFSEIVKEGNLNVCHLQTGGNLSERNGFLKSAEEMKIVDISKSDMSSPSIIKGCDHFAKKILGFSEVSLKKKKAGQKCISIKAELPLSEFILVYQDQTKPDKLPNINNATADGKSLKVKLKGTPTTIPVKMHESNATLSGNVWRIKANSPIPAKSEIKVCFDKAIDLDKISIYPIVKNVEFSGTCVAPVGTKMKKIKDNTFSICRDENTATVRIELTEESKKNLPEELLKKTTVVVKANNKEYQTKYKDGSFECEIELTNEETAYYAECDCPGYFKRVTPITTIVKGDCEPAQKEMNVVERPAIEFPATTFTTLKTNPIRAIMIEEGTDNTLDPDKFDFTVEVENGFLYDRPSIHFDHDTIVLDLHPKGEWCECLFPDTVKVKLISTPKEGAFEGEDKQFNQTVHPIKFKLEKDRPWFSRCLWVLLTIAGLGLFCFYLWGLLKKNRFKKSGRIKERHLELHGSQWVMTDWKQGRRLREKGFAAWVNRWFVPFRDERNTLSWTTAPPYAGSITFVAAELKNKVYMTRESFNAQKMKMASFNQNNQNNPKDKRKLLRVDPISIYKDGSCCGELKYDSGKRDDEKYYRIVLGVLMAASIVAICALAFLMIKAIV